MSFKPQRNIVFFGEIGTGKSSAINLILGKEIIPVSNDARPCTQTGAPYEFTLYDTRWTLWDTRGLGEAKGIFEALFGDSSKRELENFLKERHRKKEIDLLVFCVRGSRATRAFEKYYKNFCAVTRRLVAPVVVAVTHLEKEENMQGWWDRNRRGFKALDMDFDGYVCITALPNHDKSAESRTSLINLITKEYDWLAKGSGSYFGSRVRVKKSASSMQPYQRAETSLLRTMFKDNVNDEEFDFCSRAPSPSSTLVSFYTPEGSPSELSPSCPIAGPVAPYNLTAGVSSRPYINTTSDLLEVDDRTEPLSGATAFLPPIIYPNCTLPSEVHELPRKIPINSVIRIQDYPTHHGAFGDIWECVLKSGESSRRVAVKAVKVSTNSSKCQALELKLHEKKLHREWKIWGKLQHKNVVPLLGVVSGFGPLPSMVSPWLCNGSLAHFLRCNQSLEIPERKCLLADVAAGLCYLHSQDVIHGDLHSGNVLVDKLGNACLTDFGLSFMNEFVGTPYLISGLCGGVNFADPELVRRVDASSEAIYPTKPCDVYSFGGIILHVISGRKPYDEIQPKKVLESVLNGGQPQIPAQDPHLSPWYISTICFCWDNDERKRPLAKDLVTMFRP